MMSIENWLQGIETKMPTRIKLTSTQINPLHLNDNWIKVILFSSLPLHALTVWIKSKI